MCQEATQTVRAPLGVAGPCQELQVERIAIAFSLSLGLTCRSVEMLESIDEMYNMMQTPLNTWTLCGPMRAFVSSAVLFEIVAGAVTVHPLRRLSTPRPLSHVIPPCIL